MFGDTSVRVAQETRNALERRRRELREQGHQIRRLGDVIEHLLEPRCKCQLEKQPPRSHLYLGIDEL